MCIAHNAEGLYLPMHWIPLMYVFSLQEHNKKPPAEQLIIALFDISPSTGQDDRLESGKKQPKLDKVSWNERKGALNYESIQAYFSMN